MATDRTRPPRQSTPWATARLTALLFARSFLERPEWLAVALLSLAVGTSVTTALLALEREVPRRVQESLARSGPALVLQPRAGDERLSAAIVARAESALAASPGSARATFLVGAIERDRVPLLLSGVRATRLGALYPWWTMTGAWPRPGRPECALGALTAAAQHLQLGDSLDVTEPRARRLAVTGILNTGGAEDEQVLTSFSTASEILATAGAATLVTARLTSPSSDMPRYAATLSSAIPGLDAQVVRRIADAEERVLDVVAILLRAAVAIVTVCTALALTATLGTLVVEREREIGVMRALGASHIRLAVLFAGESLLLALAGGLLGYFGGSALAAGLGEHIFGAPLPLNAGLLPVALAVSCAMAAVGSVLPVARALRVEPAVILRGE